MLAGDSRRFFRWFKLINLKNNNIIDLNNYLSQIPLKSTIDILAVPGEKYNAIN